jgi:hypothetical protein
MTFRFRFSFLLLLSLVSCNAWSSSAAVTPAWELPPGWTETRGGADGKVVRVTTLAASGPGSFTEALAIAGPRTVEFAVAGIIDLAGKSIRITQPFLTVAGETAPTPGITLTNGEFSVTTHDVIIRHLRFRPGAGNRPRRSGWEPDGLTTGGGAHDVIIDHCSFSWAVDENLSASGPRFEGATPDEWRAHTSHRITFSHCVIAEGLENSTHSKGPHSKGTLLHDNTSDIAIIGNLYLSNVDRNPLFKAGVRAAVVNNLICNPGGRIMQYGFEPSQWEGKELQRAQLSIVGNVARLGPSSSEENAFFEVWPAYGPCDFLLRDNLMFDAAGHPLPTTPAFRDRTRFRPGFTAPIPGGSGYEYRLAPFAPPPEMRQVETPPTWPPRLKALPASETQAWVLANVGARPWDRDATDRRQIEEARTGRGKVIDFESEVGGLGKP